jgi:hypothetical protein
VLNAAAAAAAVHVASSAAHMLHCNSSRCLITALSAVNFVFVAEIQQFGCSLMSLPRCMSQKATLQWCCFCYCTVAVLQLLLVLQDGSTKSRCSRLTKLLPHASQCAHLQVLPGVFQLSHRSVRSAEAQLATSFPGNVLLLLAKLWRI